MSVQTRGDDVIDSADVRSGDSPSESAQPDVARRGAVGAAVRNAAARSGAKFVAIPLNSAATVGRAVLLAASVLSYAVLDTLSLIHI